MVSKQTGLFIKVNRLWIQITKISRNKISFQSFVKIFLIVWRAESSSILQIFLYRRINESLKLLKMKVLCEHPAENDDSNRNASSSSPHSPTFMTTSQSLDATPGDCCWVWIITIIIILVTQYTQLTSVLVMKLVSSSPSLPGSERPSQSHLDWKNTITICYEYMKISPSVSLLQQRRSLSLCRQVFSSGLFFAFSV